MTPEQAVMSRIAKTVFHLNGQLLAIAEDLAGPAGLTAARWQVLGTILSSPMPVAAIARELGLARQSVQRVADILVAQGLAAYQPNPSHQRAKLLVPTDRGRQAVDRIRPAHADFARKLADKVGLDELRTAAATLTELSLALGAVMPSNPSGNST
jgi:DNA-binding MarR family transcriptional regulator